MRTFLTHALSFALLGVASFAGSLPELINYQGVLRDPAGTPLDGDYDMVFRFWSEPSGGEEIFRDSHTLSLSAAVAVSRGLFNVALGSGDLSDGSGPGTYANLGDVFRDYGAVYVGIQIDSDPEMVPRIPVLASPYALNADRIDGRDASDLVTTDGGSLTGTLNLPADGLVAGTDQLVLSGGRVGIGTSTPGTPLDVVGAIRSDNQLISTLANGTAPLAVSSSTKVANLNVDLLDGLDSSEFLTSLGGSLTGTLTLAPNGLVAGTDQFVLNSGRVGVGTAAPANKLHVFGGGLTVDGASTASSISLLAGAAPNNGLGGAIELKAGTGYNMRGGHMTLQAGRTSSWSGAGSSADLWLRGGQMEAAISSFAEVHVEGGKAVAGGTNESNGGRLFLSGGNGTGTNRGGGDILLQPGAATGSGTPGYVGVGGLAPQNPLHVVGSGGAIANLADGVHLGIDASNNAHIELIKAGGSPYIDFNTSNAGDTEARIRLASSDLLEVQADNLAVYGNLGVGTATPGTPLDVVGAIRSDNQLISTLANGTAPLAVSSSTKVANLNVDLLDGLDSSEFLTSLGGSLTGTLTLAPNGLVAGTDQFVLNSGRVGVGTAAPANKLHVLGGGLTVDGASTASSISLLAGAAPNNGLGGAIDLKAGTGYNMRGGHMTLQAGRTSSWSGAGSSADLWLRGGQMEAAISSFAEVHVEGGKAVAGGTNESNGGRLFLSGGNGTGTNRGGGDILLQPGAATGSGTPGYVGVGTPSPGARLDVSGGDIRTDGQLVSTVATGQAPLSVSSTTRVDNFNADLLDGEDSSSFARTTDLHGRYTDFEAAGAMGAKYDDNPLNHDRPGRYEIAESSPRREQIALRKWYEVSTTTSFAVGLVPGAVVFDGNNVWVANRGSDTVSKLRATDGEPLGTFAVGSEPAALAFDGANIWVGNYADGTVTKLRAYDGALLDTIILGAQVDDVVFDGTNIWVAHGTTPGTVSKVRASDGVTLGTFGSAGDCAVGLEFDGTNLWIANSCGSGIVTKMEPSDGSYIGTYSAFDCNDIAFDGADLWVSSGANGEVVRIRASDGARLGTSAVGSLPAGVTFDGTNVWVANNGDDTVTKLRASDGTTLGTFATGAAPAFILFDGAAVWVTNQNDGTVSKL